MEGNHRGIVLPGVSPEEETESSLCLGLRSFVWTFDTHFCLPLSLPIRVILNTLASLPPCVIEHLFVDLKMGGRWVGEVSERFQES